MTAAVALMVSSMWMVPTAAWAAPITTLAAGAVTAISDPGATLAVPADGRIGGYGFAGSVLGVGTGRADPGAAVRAPSGQVLWVFGVRFQADVSQSTSDFSVSQETPTAVLTYGGQRVLVPLVQPQVDHSGAAVAPTVDSGNEWFAAAVPTAATDVVFEMANQGFTQDFSLTHMAREGTSPAALYRSPGTWQSIDNVAATHVFPTPYVTPDGNYNLPDESLTVGLDMATLSYFGPDGTTDPAPSPSQAWLIPDLSDPFNPNNANVFQTLEYLTPLQASNLELSWPGQPPVHPKALPGGPDHTGGGGSNSLFTDRYAFAVPATLTAATLTISVPTEQVTPAGSGEPYLGLHVGTATFPITFPPAAAPAAPPGAATVPSRLPDDTSAGIAGSSGGAVGLIAIIAIGFAPVGVATVWRKRSRRKVQAAADGSSVDTRETEKPNWAHPSATASPGGPWSNGHAPSSTTPGVGEPTLAVHPVDHVNSNGFGDSASAAPPVLIPVPAAPRLPAGGELRVLVLGLVELIGWPDDVPGPGQTVLELLTFLALHPGRQFSAEQLRTALGRGRTRDLDVASIRRYLGELRRVLGDRLPDSRKLGAYQLIGVDTDAALLEQAVGEAAEAHDPVAKAEALAQALAMVRGVPFAGSEGEAFGWAYVDDMVSARLSNAVLSAAIDLADLALGAGDAVLAAWAVERGSLVWPGDESLDLRALSAAAMARPSRIEQTWAAITSRRVMGEIVEPSPQLRAHYRRLAEQSTATPLS